MMHELPVPIHQSPGSENHSNPASREQSKPKKETERRLPSGAKVDFGNGSGSKKQQSNQKPKKGSDSEKKKANRANSPALPNGEKPNFYNDNKEKNKKLLDPSLPNGAKPNFSFYSESNSNSNSNVSSNSNKTKKKVHEQSLPSGEKPVFHDKPNKKTSSSNRPDKNGKKGPVEETYAGSSFHSSPAALNLPKPSFQRTSPKQQANTINDENSSPSSSASSVSMSSPRPVAGAVAAPPRYPVTAYPPGSIPGAVPNVPAGYYPPQYAQPQYIQPGFTYNVNPQGYIQYQYPPFHHPLAPAQIPYQQHPFPVNAQPPAHVGSAPQGQKISFDDLLGSAKK